MCSLWDSLRADTREGKRLFSSVQTGIQTSTKENPQNAKQKTIITKSLYSVRSNIYANTWQSESVQPRMPRPLNTTEQTPLPNENRTQTKYVYDIEVEDNHNFFADSLLVSNCIYWDEANHTPRDEELYTAILFTISTTKGKVLISSTPWNTDAVFYKIFHHKDYGDFARSHVTWRESMAPHGPLDRETLEKIRRQFGADPWRWKREMEAEWAEDETAWLSQALITKCIATEKTLGQELKLFRFERSYRKLNLYAGLDLGRVKDYSVLTVVEEVKGRFFLRHVKIFPLETSYASVIGYVKTLQDRWGGFCKLRVDSTNQDYVVEDMKNSDVENVEGVHFTLPRKQEMATLLKQRMVNNRFWYPYFTWAKPYRSEWVTELNVERFELRKDGSIAFNHPQGTHDDVWWATALALYATVEMTEEPYVGLIPK